MFETGANAPVISINGSNDLGNASSPVKLCPNVSLSMKKKVDIAPSCYLYRYRIELVECTSSYQEYTGNNGIHTNIFNDRNTNSTLNSFPAWEFTFTGYNLFNGYLESYFASTVAHYFKIKLVGYVDNCPDIEEIVLKEIYLYTKAPDVNNTVSFKLGTFGTSTSSLSAAASLPYYNISSAQHNGFITVLNSKALYNSGFVMKLRKPIAIPGPNLGQPDPSAAGIVWCSLDKDPSTPSTLNAPPYDKATPISTGGQNFTKNIGLIGGVSIWGINSDFYSYIFSQMPTALMNTDLFLELSTVSNCDAYSCDVKDPNAQYLKIRVQEGAYSSAPDFRVTAESNLSLYNRDLTNPANPIGSPYDCIASPPSNNTVSSKKSYTMGHNTGLFQILMDVSPLTIDGFILRLDIDEGNGDGWTPMFNPNYYTATVNNSRTRTNTTGTSSSSDYNYTEGFKIPINNPYGEFEVSDCAGCPTNLFVYPYYPDWFHYNIDNGNFQNIIFKFEAAAFSYLGAANIIPNSSGGNFGYGGATVGYFMCDYQGALNTRSAQNNPFTRVPKEGKVDFRLVDHQLKGNLIAPEGATFGYEVYDLVGRKMAHSPSIFYKNGTHHLEADLSQTNTDICIIRYTLNGETYSLKLGNSNE
jgi:hypothetical protein